MRANFPPRPLYFRARCIARVSAILGNLMGFLVSALICVTLDGGCKYGWVFALCVTRLGSVGNFILVRRKSNPSSLNIRGIFLVPRYNNTNLGP